ncbi:uncharacterized protein LOC120017335 [Tripterygium wilfordii]|uniref:uncharacterized protein LOC120017335 n=1 Tax=Tripterygium wilfordii TaxID=458696 RepID=UPI0018F7FB32|nr:uncharacterized protein LOC120017335 [Tripterygium wilfordii]
MDELTRHIQGEVSWCMLFAEDIVLVNDTISRVNSKLEIWRQALECKRFKLSRTKIKYMKCTCSKIRRGNKQAIELDGREVRKNKAFKYLGSIFQEDRDISDDVVNRMKNGWDKWKSESGILCDRIIPSRFKGKFYRSAIRPANL